MFPVLLKQGSFNKHASLGSSSCGFVSRMLFSKLVFSFFQTWRWQGSSLLTDQTYFLVSETCMFVKLPSFRGPRTWALVYSFQYRDNVKSKATVSSKASPKTVFKNPPSISIQNWLSTALLFFTKQLLKKLTFIQNRWQKLL